jgi:hypothetical protein
MLWHVNNRKLLCYGGLFFVIAAALCFRAGEMAIGGVCLAISGSGFAVGWLASQHPHLHSK